MKRLLLALPYRQRALLIATVSIGFLILLCSAANILPFKIVNILISFYSFSLPFVFLGFPIIIDLDNNRNFLVWLLLSILLLSINFATRNSDKFIIHRSAQFDPSSRIHSLLSTHSTSSLKSLFFFLVVYWLLNLLLKRSTGNCMVNTFRQTTWYNSDAGRRIKGIDVLCNIVLMMVILCSMLF